MSLLDGARVSLWLLAGLISLFFSLGNARIWTSISTGFFLVFISEAYLVAPWGRHGTIMAMHSVVGIVAVLIITFGFMEYYVFSRTLEAPGGKWVVYATTLGVLLAAAIFLASNAVPGPAVVRNVRLVENAIWTATALINIDLLRRIHRQVKDTPIAPGFLGFIAAFLCIVLWRGAQLYLQVYNLDEEARTLGLGPDGLGAGQVPFRVTLSAYTHRAASMLSSITVGGVFVYLVRALR